MPKGTVNVTYYFRDENKNDSLSSIEIQVKRQWEGMRHETMKSLAARHVPPMDSIWMTVSRDDKSAVTFRVTALESIEYDEEDE